MKWESFCNNSQKPCGTHKGYGVLLEVLYCTMITHDINVDSSTCRTIDSRNVSAQYRGVVHVHTSMVAAPYRLFYMCVNFCCLFVENGFHFSIFAIWASILMPLSSHPPKISWFVNIFRNRNKYKFIILSYLLEWKCEFFKVKCQVYLNHTVCIIT